jgi:hypothetical protein
LIPTKRTKEIVMSTVDQKVFRAREFILEDENGNARARLSMTEGEPTLALYDEKGKPRIEMSVNRDGPELALLDENGKLRAQLAVVGDAMQMVLLDSQERFRAGLAADKNGAVGMELADHNGKRRIGLTVDRDADTPMMSLKDKNEKPCIQVAVYRDAPGLLFQENGTNRATLQKIEDTFVLGLFDKHGRAIWRAP